MNINPFLGAEFPRLVGLDGLEPSTSRLSGVRSNHLSYRPLFSAAFQVRLRQQIAVWWRWRESNPWPPACRAGALPAELHPHIGICFAVSAIRFPDWSLKIEQQDLLVLARLCASRRILYVTLSVTTYFWIRIRPQLKRRSNSDSP